MKIVKLKIKSKGIKAIKSINKFKSGYIEDILIEKIQVNFGYVIFDVAIYVKKPNYNYVSLCKKIHKYLYNRDEKYIEMVVTQQP
ncbi:hypothetical protein [Clostridium baratii]|uniref:hypothetical protein n=1 Tax=Clostridium baratii TaxID=1561 RepID=UPI001C0305E1|nr:hypothetical protein [Clostridium baratii]MBT9830306.1 hypothetical protein [Clostridium baratii]